MTTIRFTSAPRKAAAAKLPTPSGRGARALLSAIGRKAVAAVARYIEARGHYYERSGMMYPEDLFL